MKVWWKMHNDAKETSDLEFGDLFYTIRSERTEQLIPYPVDNDPRFGFRLVVCKAVCLQFAAKHIFGTRRTQLIAVVKDGATSQCIMVVPEELVFKTADDARKWIAKTLRAELENYQFQTTVESKEKETEE